MGREVTTLVNEAKSAGTYNAKFNTVNLPAGRQGLSSGVYIYTLKINSAAGNFVSSKKMIVTK